MPALRLDDSVRRWARAGIGPQPVRLGRRSVRYRPEDLSARIADARIAEHSTDDEIVRTFVEAITGPADVPEFDDLADSVDEQLQRRQRAKVGLATAVRVRDQLAERRTRMLTTGADHALGHLGEELDALLDQARPLLPRVATISDADHAIAAGVAETWGVVTGLAARHRELRGAQRTVVTAALLPPDQPPTESRVTSEARRLVNTLGTVRDPSALVGPGELRVHFDGRPDPHGRRAPLPWTSSETVTDLRAVAATDAWVPRVAELLAARDTLLATTDKPDPERITVLASSERTY